MFSPPQILSMIEEAAGTRMFETKKVRRSFQTKLMNSHGLTRHVLLDGHVDGGTADH